MKATTSTIRHRIRLVGGPLAGLDLNIDDRDFRSHEVTVYWAPLADTPTRIEMKTRGLSDTEVYQSATYQKALFNGEDTFWTYKGY